MPAPRPFALIRTQDQWLRASHENTALQGEVVQLFWHDEAAQDSDKPDPFSIPGAGLAFDSHCRLYHSVTDEGRIDARGLARSGEERRPAIKSGDALEKCLLRAIVDDVCVRNLAASIALGAIVTPKQDHSIGTRKRWRLEQHRVDNTEDRGIGPDPKRKREHRNDRKPRPLQQPPHRKPNIFD